MDYPKSNPDWILDVVQCCYQFEKLIASTLLVCVTYRYLFVKLCMLASITIICFPGIKYQDKDLYRLPIVCSPNMALPN